MTNSEPALTDVTAGPDAFAPAILGPVRLRNRVLKAATFEGRTARNLVTDDLIEFHRTSAAGGVAVSTLAFCAVSRSGRGLSLIHI